MCVRSHPVLRGFGRARRGAAAVEMALIAPVLVFLAAGVIDFGTGVYTKMMVADAAPVPGAAYAQLNAQQLHRGVVPVQYQPGLLRLGCQRAERRDPGPRQRDPVQLGGDGDGDGDVVLPRQRRPRLPPTAPGRRRPPACIPAAPAAGTYTEVTTGATLTTLLPYAAAAQAFNLGSASPIALTANYFVRVQ